MTRTRQSAEDTAAIAARAQRDRIAAARDAIAAGLSYAEAAEVSGYSATYLYGSGHPRRVIPR